MTESALPGTPHRWVTLCALRALAAYAPDRVDG